MPVADYPPTGEDESNGSHLPGSRPLYIVEKADMERVDKGALSLPLPADRVVPRRDELNIAVPKTETKDTNPKDAIGIKKPPITTVPLTVMAEVGVGMMEGAMKYGRHNYRVAGVRASVYVDATWRHLMSWWEGEDIDPDSRLSHITKAICSLTVLRDAMINDMWHDDRPPVPHEFMSELQAAVTKLLEKYPDPVKPYTKSS